MKGNIWKENFEAHYKNSISIVIDKKKKLLITSNFLILSASHFISLDNKIIFELYEFGNLQGLDRALTFWFFILRTKNGKRFFLKASFI